MNIKEFLIDNYIWIIVIILITIITIIGFLADKKKSSKKNEEVPTQNPNNINNQPVNNIGQMQYNGLNQQMPNQMDNNMNMGINANNMNNQMQQQAFNNNVQKPQNLGNINNQNQMVQEQPMQMNFSTNNNPIPVENLEPIKTVEPIYQPLSEQKPIIEPHPVPNFPTPQNNQPMNNFPQENVQNITPQVSSLTYGQPIQQAYMQENQIKEPSNYQIPNQQQLTISNNNFVNNPSFNQPNTTIPEPINSTIPTPQPVRPQSIVQPTYNNQPQMQNNYGQTSQMEHLNQPIQSNPQQASISFVYGPQQNNQNM